MRIYAHRGASARAPENTLPAFDAAADLGAPFVECDVQRTADGVLVVIHDDTVTRTTDAAAILSPTASAAVGALSLAQLRRLDAGSWFDPRFAGARIPTLTELLGWARDRDVGLLIEAKGPARYPGLAWQLAQTLTRHGGLLRRGAERLVVQSFDGEFVRDFRRALPRVALGLLGAPADPQRWTRLVDQINPPHQDLTQSYVDRLHAAGVAVNPWTADEPADLARLTALGVDGIITNTPDRLPAR